MVPSPHEDSRVADLRGEGVMLSECLILQDYEGARLGAQLMRELALTLGLDHVRTSAELLLLHLGPAGSPPSSGVGPAAWVLAEAVMDKAG